MKFILCGVFLAHGAAVCAVCAMPAVGLGGGVTVQFSVVNKEPTHQCHPRESEDPLRGDCLKNTCQKINRGSARFKMGPRFRQDDKTIGNSQDGWQVHGDIHPPISRSLTLNITVDANGHIKSWNVIPQLSAHLHKDLDRQIQKLHFTWTATTPPPERTIFEKKIIVR